MALNNEPTSLVVAVDIGGSFTDVALVDHQTGRSWRAKTPSIPADPSEAFLNGIRLALGQAGAVGADLDQVLHGTTVATNMILEGKGARAAMVTTRGFRHVLAIGRQDIPRKANLYTWVKPVPPVPSSRIVEVDERVAAGGEVIGALNEDSVRAAAASIKGMNVEAVAVCLLHAYANPDHERRVAEILREELPDLAITVSSDVLPVVREYERSLTTVLNATVMPGVTSYVARLEQRLKDEGATPPLMLMQSNGGVAGAAKIRVAPALTALSGPAAGVVGARAEAEACGISDIITVDIGGTSADICLIKDGKIGLTQQGSVGDWPLALPMVDMITIGAHVVLGQLPARLLGGTMLLDTDAAHKAVASVADPLGIDMETAARGILAIADNHMVGAIRVVSVERGHDPRDFTLVPFGGAGPLHGCALADLLGIRRVLITNAPGVLCANGLLVADLKSEFSRALAIAGPMNGPETETIIADLEGMAQSWLDDEGVVTEAREIERVALMRYAGQGGEIAVPWSPDPKKVEASFAEKHKSLYGFALSAPIELVTLRVHATGLARNAPGITLQPGEPPEPSEFISVMIAGAPTSGPVIDRATLGAGSRFDGPAILIQLDTTTFVGPDWSATVHPSGNILLEKAAL